jgi:ATP-dependent RNA helicase RhlE
MSFTSLGLSPALLRAAAELGFQQPTPVQTAAIPPLLAGRDLLVQARTGSGKTAAFALPLLQHWMNGTPRSPKPVRGLVLVPTRELAQQVGEVLRDVAHHLPGLAKVAVVFGGVSINPQMMGLRGGADIVVATPGRLLDLLRQNALHLDAVQTLVLDEADRLLDLGFADELNELLALMPAQRQTVFCSATFPPAVKALASSLLRDPEEIRLATMVAARSDIVQRALLVDESRRTMLLKELVQQHPEERVMVFVATKYATELVADKLGRHGIVAAYFHGEMSQGARTRTLQDFKDQRAQVLVATDMAARGLHIDALPRVVNYDLPRSPEDYLHRIGRTGRAGGQGEAISFITPSAEPHFRLIENRQGVRIPRETIEGFEPTTPIVTRAGSAGPGTGLDPNGGIKGARKSKKDKLREAAAEAANERKNR